MESTLKIIEQRLTKLEDAVFGTKGKIKAASSGKVGAGSDFSGATGGVRFLISKGFFQTKRSLSDTKEALPKHDYHYSAQVVQMALTRLSKRDGQLVSFREGGKKLYAKRK